MIKWVQIKPRVAIWVVACSVWNGPLGAQTFVDVSGQAGFFGENSSWAGAWSDYDKDGDPDVVTLGHSQGATASVTQLWQNNGDGTFSDVTEQVGMEPNNIDPHGAVWADFDDDGYPDLYEAKTTGTLVDELWHNNGDSTFTDIAASAGLTDIGHLGRGAYAVDHDVDGDLDLLVMNFNVPGAPFLSSNLLYRYDSGLLFTEVGAEAGIERIGESNRTASWSDYNGDGEPDVLMMWPCALFANRGDGTFEDVTLAAGIVNTDDCASSAWADYDNDGDTDVYVSMSVDKAGLLYRNNGDGTFSDVTVASGAVNESNARGVIWSDYDNDGHMDLYVVNTVNNTVPNRLFRNQGDGSFMDVTEDAGVGAQVGGRGVDASFVDYNNDGALDLFITNGLGSAVGPYVLLENSGNTNHWLKVDLIGRRSNRDGIMTRAVVTTSEGSQFQEYNGPSHYMAQDSTPLHFGAGAATAVDRLELTWPSGITQTVENLAVDQKVTITEGSSIVGGQPTIEGLGYYIWRNNGNEEWQIRWLGDADARHTFTGHITSDGEFTSVTPVQFEQNDTVTWDVASIDFSGFAKGRPDSLRFRTTGTSVTLELLQDGVEQPQFIYIGSQGVIPASLPLTLTP